jgi:hypothetical protein
MISGPKSVRSQKRQSLISNLPFNLLFYSLGSAKSFQWVSTKQQSSDVVISPNFSPIGHHERQKVGRVLRHNVAKVDRGTPLGKLWGVTSLIVV